MPVLSLQPWSQFSAADPSKTVQPGTAGQFVFQGGKAVPLLLRVPGGAGKLELEQAVTVGEAPHPCGAVIEVTAEVAAPDGKRGHAVTINGLPAGVCLVGDQRLRGGDMVTVEAGAPTSLPEPEPFSGILCFAAGTPIETPTGPRRVETLRPGEIVTTADKGEMHVTWTGRREVLFVRGDNRYRPVLFHAGSLGPDSPTADLVVSPDHQVVLHGPDVAELTGNTAALAPAGALTELRGVRQMLGKRRITYIHVMLENHAVLRAAGAEAESFYPTPDTLAALSDDQRSSVFAHVPALRIAPETAYGPTALPMIDWDNARDLAVARKEGAKATKSDADEDDDLKYAAE